MKPVSLAIPILLLACACSGGNPPPQPAPARPPAASAEAPTAPATGVVELRAVGMRFEGPAEIPAGWTTFRFDNASLMIHFAMIDVPPAEVSLQQFSNELMLPFQAVMDAMNAGDEAAVEAAFGTFPAWVGDLGRAGGPGLLSPGLAGETTVYLSPGRYVLECYVKTNGIFHTTPPAEGQVGMVLEMTVTEEDNGVPEPESTATVALGNTGINLVDGAFRAGTNTIRVEFTEQQALPSFVGNDVHLLRVDAPGSLAAANDWMDWRTPEGLQDPSPVVFLGGVQDMAAGSHAYFTVELTPGDYALMAEVPDPLGMGLVLPFSVE
jgi:hypothetical protein